MSGLILVAVGLVILAAALWLFHRADQARREAQRDAARHVGEAVANVQRALVEERQRAGEREAELLAVIREQTNQLMWLTNKPWELAPAALPSSAPPPPTPRPLLGVGSFVGDDDVREVV